MTSISRNSISALFALFVALALAAWSFAQTTDAQQNEHFTRSFAVSPGSTLSIENYKGAIHVAAASGNQVVVNVDKKFEYADCRAAGF